MFVWRGSTLSKTDALLGKLFSQGEAAALMVDPKFNKVVAGITNNHMAAVAEAMGDDAILGTMDVVGIPHYVYNKLIQIIKYGVSKVNKHLNFNSMPIACWVSEFHPTFLKHNVQFAILFLRCFFSTFSWAEYGHGLVVLFSLAMEVTFICAEKETCCSTCLNSSPSSAWLKRNSNVACLSLLALINCGYSCIFWVCQVDLL
jgi:hypothetical protein